MSKRVLIPFVAALTVAAAVVGTASASSAKGKVAPEYTTMIIVGHTLGQKGPDGLQHDTTYGADFTAAVGKEITVTVYNYDEGPHTITAPGLGLNVKIAGALDEEKGVPSKKVFSFTPKKAGTFRWNCNLPCDAGQKYWAMGASKAGPGKSGFMAGTITVEG